MTINLEQGTRVFLSELGHNGFFYPTDSSETLIEQTSAHLKAWVGSADKTAVLIPESAVRTSGSEAKLIAVWVDKSFLSECKLQK